MLSNWPISIWYEVYRKVFTKQAIEISILIPIIPWNIFKLYAKKVSSKYDKIYVFGKNPH